MRVMKSIATPVALFFFYTAMSQQQPAHHIGDDGKLYWRKNAPAYLFIAEEPDGERQRLKSEKTPAYADPFYFDTEGVNYVRTKEAVDPETREPIPGTEVLFEVYADGLPPVTSASYENVSRYQSPEKIFYKAGLQVTFSAEDQLSGIDALYAGVNVSATPQYSGPYTFNNAGDYQVDFFAEDNVGNREEKQQIAFTIDPTPPFSDLNINGITEDNVISQGSKIYLLVEDSISGVADVFYKFDGDEFQKYNGSTIPFVSLEEGDHEITYYSVDRVNNIESEKSFTFFFDKSAPLMVADVLGDRFIVEDEIYFSGRTKLKLTAVDNKVGVKEIMYSVDTDEFTRYEQPFYLPSISGVHTIRYYSVDNLDNSTVDETKSKFIGQGGFEEFKHNVSKFYVDLTGPVISHTISEISFVREDTLFIGPKSDINIQGNDPESGLNHLSYTLNNAAGEETYEGAFTIDAAEEGYHTLNYFGYDNVNNRNVAEFSFYLDSTPPEVNIQFSIGNTAVQDGKRVYPKNAGVFLFATDVVSGIKSITYKLDNKDYKNYQGLIRRMGKGEHTLQVKVLDYLDNESTAQVEFILK